MCEEGYYCVDGRCRKESGKVGSTTVTLDSTADTTQDEFTTDTSLQTEETLVGTVRLLTE